MKLQIAPLIVCTLTLMTCWVGSTPASADDYRKINRMARKIDNTAASIARESTHFVRSPYYAGLVHETHQLRQLACHVRDVAKSGCDLQHLHQDVIALGNAYHNLDAKLCFIEQANPGCQRARRLRRLLDSVQQDLQQMVSSVTCLLNAYSPPPVYPQPGYGQAPADFDQGSGWGQGYGMESGVGHIHDGISGRNQVRYPTISSLHDQARQRSAALESQLRAGRTGQGSTLNLGGGRLTITF